MTDQGSDASNQTQAEGEAPNVKETPAAPAVDVAALQKEIEALAAKVDERERDNAKLREKVRGFKQADESNKLKAGEYEPIIAERDATIEELRAKVAELEPDAKARRDWLKAEEAAIAAEADALEEADRAIVAALPFDQRRAAIARLSGVKTKERPPEHPAASPSPPVADPKAFPSGISQSDPETWARIKQAAGIKPSGHKRPSWAK